MASSLDAATIQRFARQIALPEIGPEGQARLGAAQVVVAGQDRAADVAATYLRAAGVGLVRRVGTLGGCDAKMAGSLPWPVDGVGWRAVLAGASLVVRSGFDDDAMLGVVKQLGMPAVVMRGRRETVDVISFPARAPADADEAAVEPPGRAAVPADCGAAAVVAGTVAAAEALHALLGHGPRGRARALRLPLDGSELPQVQEMPWA